MSSKIEVVRVITKDRQDLKRYADVWDRYAPDLYRFACFLTENREQAMQHLELTFVEGLKKTGFPKGLYGGEKSICRMFYREVWSSWSGLAGEEKRLLAMLYLIHIQGFERKQAWYIVRK